MYVFYYDGKEYTATSEESLIAQLQLIDSEIDWQQGLHDIQGEEIMTYDTSTWETDFNTILVKLNEGKFISINPVENSSDNKMLHVSTSENSATISNEKDRFRIEVVTTRDGEALGLSQISITLPSGAIWIGSIQDLMAMQNYSRNAVKLIIANGYEGEEVTELQTVLSLFGEKYDIPIPSATHERSKEMAMIATIMAHHYFDKLVASASFNGVIACYDLIADWAAEFYKTYRDFNWEEMTHADGSPDKYTNVTGWEDTVVYFTADKMTNLSNA